MLLKPILQCLVDQEPTAFHSSDADRETFSFAINLSLDCRGNGTTPEDAHTEDDAAKQQYLDFLKAALKVEFHLFEVPAAGTQLSYAGPVHSTSGISATQDPKVLWDWLDGQKPAGETKRYWTSVPASQAEVVVDADDVTATHLLRAAQSWNAPVAHRFGLTHVVRVARDRIADGNFVILPYFEHLPGPPTPPEVDPEQAPDALDYIYDPKGGFGDVTGRTNAIGHGTKPLHPSDIDAGLNDDGYVTIYPDAEDARRLLVWLEERAASLMTANLGLFPHGDNAQDPEFEQLFKLGYNAVPPAPTPPAKPDKLNWQNESAPWYVVARLVSALDNLVIALLKPAAVAAGARTPEGEILSPFVTALIRRLDGIVALDGVQLAGFIRKVLTDNSPLLSDKGNKASLVAALRHVYGLPGAPVPPKLFLVDERTLVTALLEDFANPNQQIDPQSFGYLQGLKGNDNKPNTAQAVSRLLLDLEQVLHEEAGAEAAIVRLIETVETGNNRFTSLLANAITQDHSLLPRVQDAVDGAWSDYRALLDGSFNGAEAIRRAAGSTFVLALLSFKNGQQVPVEDGQKLPDSEFLRRIVHDSAFYERRVFPPDHGPTELQAVTDALLTLHASSLPVATQSALRQRLQRAFDAAFQPMDLLNKSKTRFIPDSMPQPLAIQIAGNIDGSKLDDFAKHFNGIGIAIRRVDGTTQDVWAHANLADLGWKPMPKIPDPLPAGYVFPDEPPADVTGAIHPMLPALSDGRGPMFIEYQGFPFADRPHDARIVDGDPGPRDPRRPFYRHDPYVGTVFPQVPRLAYGRAFQTFSFITSNAGTLPLALQLDPASPWMPTPVPPTPSPTDPEKPLIGKSNYQRRTAIAQMAVIESTEGDEPRIGAEIAGVTPLARDYPRTALLAEPNEAAARDVMREADGSGTMVAKQYSEWRLSDIQFGGVPESLTLKFFDRPANNPKDAGDATFQIDEDTVPGFTAISEIAISIEFEPVEAGLPKRWLHVRCGGTTLDRQSLPDGDSVFGWLRLVLQSFNHGPATMTFASAGTRKSDNVSDPLLLLAPSDDDSKIWKEGLSDSVEIAVSAPRVGYLDFDRWFANANLRKDMFFKKTDKPGDIPAIETSVRLLEQSLVAAYVMRHLDPNIAAALDRLPDPAVEQIRIELTPHDTLIGQEPVLGKDTHLTLSIKDELQEFGRDFATEIVDEMLDHDNLWDPQHKRPVPIPWSPRRLLLFLFPRLEKRFRFKIVVSPEQPTIPQDSQPARSLRLDRLTKDTNPPWDEGYSATLAATIPEGVVARLSIDALVPAAHFEPATGTAHPAVFHSGLKQYALRELGEYLTFPSAALRVETMYDGMSGFAADPHDVAQKKAYPNQPAIDLAAAMIGVEGVEKNRKYDIITSALPPGDAATRQWRLLHEIDVTTQRWRTTGRPIYHYVNPRQYRFDRKPEDAAVPHPALRLDFGRDASDELAQFELEAFFDRPDIDAQTITKTLDPLPARTVLQEIQWNPESATYFRHRFRLRSRYAGALKQRDRGEAIAWPDRKDSKAVPDVWTSARAWTMRVAMLADLANVKMTRPQLRVLIPLTTAPGRDEVRKPAPPVAAILQEPPFARGGLADRIASEVKTGFSYGFSYDDRILADDTHHLEILDSRKEGGPDPRLDYRRLDKETAYGLVLRSEGPMGLTFDNIDAPAPAYPNAMFSLLPATLNSKKENKTVDQSFEEMFVGAAMRRYIDPWWTTEARQTADKLNGERCWWLVRKTFDGLPANLLTYAVPGNDQAFPPLLVVDKDDASIVVSASRLAVDGIGPSETNDEKDLVAILKVDRASVLELAVLHQPVAPGRYSASVFVTTSSANTQRGEINAPQMLASFEWSPPLKDEYGRPKPALATISGQDVPAYLTLASAPTFVRWTRTGRDVDYLHLKIDEDAWTTDRKHVRDLVATLEKDHFSFALKGVDHPIWLCPSTFDNPYPIHVHRHLAIISSYVLKELGRPAELFCRTALVQGRLAALITPDGKRADLAENSMDQIVRVVEFETPAQILCDGKVLAPKKYQEAYFDLLSTGFDGNADGTLHLFFRIVGPPAHQSGFTGLDIKLRPAIESGKAPPTTIQLKFANSTQSFVVGIHLDLQQSASQNAPTVVDVRLLQSDGKLVPVKGNFAPPPRITKLGLFVAVEATGPSGHEFWTDISLLHSSDVLGQPRLDFDWLFSLPSPNGQVEEPAVSVSPGSLNLMHEAQARVVAVSSPISIEKR